MATDLCKVIFCSISNTKTKEILHSYTTDVNGYGYGNGNGNDSSSSIESLAHLCLDHTPPFHSHYSHTTANRTFAFLIDSDLTYFLIATADATDPIALLYQIRNKFNNGTRPTQQQQQQQQHLLDIIITITRGGGGGPTAAAAAAERQQRWPLSGSSSTKAPLLDRREVGVESSPAASASASAAATQLQMKKRRSSSARKVWWRHVKVVMVVDLFLCVVLFGIWMAVCRGFYCLS